jgi:hypothetical protein
MSQVSNRYDQSFIQTQTHTHQFVVNLYEELAYDELWNSDERVSSGEFF